jgi:glyceraldehyde 3-phosphate dehydrogenase
MLNVAINGYGRIGRVVHRIILQNYSSEIKIVAINAGSSTDLKGWAHLLKYDSNYGVLSGFAISVKEEPEEAENPSDKLGFIIINGEEIPVYSQKDPTKLPWKELAVDVVIESTGHFLTIEKTNAHIDAGARKVVISAPAKDDTPTYVFSINDGQYQGEDIINNASCTTNCIAPVAKIIEENFGIEKAMMTTVHAYTSDQELQDGGHKDYRRARASAKNIVPTTTGATKAAAKALPSLKDKFSGLSIRVPVSVGSLSDFTFLLKRETTKEEVNEVLIKASESEVYKKYLSVTNDPIVSSDIVGDEHSSIVDLVLTQVVGGNMVKVIAWYDNEWGYSCRLAEEVLLVGKDLQH